MATLKDTPKVAMPSFISAFKALTKQKDFIDFVIHLQLTRINNKIRL
jgi:hypothetical protein